MEVSSSSRVGLPYHTTLRINFPIARQALIVKQCMEVDEELTDKTAKEFRVEDSVLVV